VTTLGPKAAAGADLRQIAQESVDAWNRIDAALSPVLGKRGVAALYKRSLHLTATPFPWLAAAYEGALEPGDFSSLRSALEQHPAGDAAVAHDALLQTFHGLLADLIGRSLTDRLLQAVWNSPASGHAAQDPS
jgi:hypothetical protein